MIIKQPPPPSIMATSCEPPFSLKNILSNADFIQGLNINSFRTNSCIKNQRFNNQKINKLTIVHIKGALM